MECMELLFVTRKKIRRNLFIPYIRRVSYNNVCRMNISGQKVRLKDVIIEWKCITKSGYAISAVGYFGFINVVCKDIISKSRFKIEPKFLR